MKYSKLIIILLIAGFCSCEQHSSTVKRPKLVIGLVIDQMRWDYLYRYYDLYGNDGFKRLLKEGYNCQNTSINYLPANTGPGHACIYTGSVPSIHGIAGNEWIDNLTGNKVYCVKDTNFHLVGDDTKACSNSPANLLTTTITDELQLATNFKSRVYGVAIKDRASILPAGHLANAAYWYSDKTGTFTTSSYYPNQNPGWLQAFNRRKAGDSMVKVGWKLLYNPSVYTQSTVDANIYEKAFKGEKAPVFPHVFDSLADSDRYKVLVGIPFGNTLSIMMAKACIEGEKLGLGQETDFLALSISSTDIIGHQFAPNSIEIEDCYLRLDQDIASFLKYLDAHYGKGNYLFFMTADHGGAHNAVFLSEKDVPSGIENANITHDLNTYLKGQFGRDSIVRGILNYQVFLNDSLFMDNHAEAAPGNETNISYKRVLVGRGRHARYKVIPVRTVAPKPVVIKLDRDKIKQSIIQWLKNRSEVSYVIDMEDMDKTPVPEPIRQMVINGYNRMRSGVIQIVLNPGWYDYGVSKTGSTHGSWNPYDTHIPLVWYGWHIPKGETYKQVNMTDISATLAALLHIQAPNGCTGKPITEITDKKIKKHLSGRD